MAAAACGRRERPSTHNQGLRCEKPASLHRRVFFALTGLTLGLMAPVLFAAEGTADPEHAGRGMAAVVSLGYVGLTAGPAIVGLVAQASSLVVALGMMAGLSLVIRTFGGVARLAYDSSFPL